MTSIHDAAKAIMQDPRAKSDVYAVRMDSVFGNWDVIRWACMLDGRDISYYFDDQYIRTIQDYAGGILDDMAELTGISLSKHEVLDCFNVLKWCKRYTQENQLNEK